jgi:protein phosphatase/serine/threonine-protein phosphatase Stp1
MMSTAHRYRFSAKTHTGKIRKLNEDSILVLADQHIWVVSDGMGGHEAGDYASRIVVDSIALLPPGLLPHEKMPAVRAALQQAHAVIRAEAEARNTTIGATVVAFFLSDGHFGALWAGDSRLYRLRDGVCDMLTVDHSLVGALVEAGRLTWDEAEHHPQSNAITRAVGVGEDLELDKIRGEVETGDRYLLCSDGLSKYLTIAGIGRAMEGVPIEIVSDELVQIAMDGGGADNISVIVVDVI